MERMQNPVEDIISQIQELENLANAMLDAGNFNSEIFEQISQHIQEYHYQLEQKQALQSQRNEINYKDNLLEEVDVQKIYKENGGKEQMTFANGISKNEYALDVQFNNFLTGSDESQVVFVCENHHWLTVRLEKTLEGGINYQVADSLEGEGANIRMDKIREIFNYDGIKEIPFKSEKQQNGYDCGIYCALNAIDMKPNVVLEHKLEHKYFNAKSIYSQDNVDAIRANFEKEKIAKQKPAPLSIIKQQVEDFRHSGKNTPENTIDDIDFRMKQIANELDDLMNASNPDPLKIQEVFERSDALNKLRQQTVKKQNANKFDIVSHIENQFNEGKITPEQAIKNIESSINDATKLLYPAFQRNPSEPHIAIMLKRIDDLNSLKETIDRPRQQQSSLLTSSNALYSQRPPSNISIIDSSSQLKRKAPVIQQKKSNNALEDVFYGRS